MTALLNEVSLSFWIYITRLQKGSRGENFIPRSTRVARYEMLSSVRCREML